MCDIRFLFIITTKNRELLKDITDTQYYKNVSYKNSINRIYTDKPDMFGIKSRIANEEIIARYEKDEGRLKNLAVQKQH